ncbi:MAG: DsbA family protein [Patescibacteria group bacterium]|nr:DsbA family protein [Patescibacteria group bacterium]
MKSQYVLPISIVVVGILIAGGVFLISRNPGSSGNTATQAVRPVDSTDHIYGNPNAPVKIVEYADLECPFCKNFESTMDQLMQYYGPSGKVAWVFRPFPLAQIHSKAPEESQAAECAASLGGNTAFFKYIDTIYSITPSDNGLDLSQLPVVAGEVGLNVQQFNQCLNSNQFASKVQADYNEAIAEGFQGTPSIVIMANNQPVLQLVGDQPYASMRAAVDQVLQAIGQSISTSTTASSTGQ